MACQNRIRQTQTRKLKLPRVLMSFGMSYQVRCQNIRTRCLKYYVRIHVIVYLKYGSAYFVIYVKRLTGLQSDISLASYVSSNLFQQSVLAISRTTWLSLFYLLLHPAIQPQVAISLFSYVFGQLYMCNFIFCNNLSGCLSLLASYLSCQLSLLLSL